jgi:hypothetical protein
MKKLICFLSLVSLWLPAGLSHADWYGGTLTHVSFAYDGKTIVFHMNGFNRTNCTCYPTWGNYFCLDANRETYKYEFAAVLSAAMSGKSVSANIDPVSCMVKALEIKGS